MSTPVSRIPRGSNELRRGVSPDLGHGRGGKVGAKREESEGSSGRDLGSAGVARVCEGRWRSWGKLAGEIGDGCEVRDDRWVPLGPHVSEGVRESGLGLDLPGGLAGWAAAGPAGLG